MKRIPFVLIVLGWVLGGWLRAAPPANDDFSSAQYLTGPLPVQAGVTTREATREALEPGPWAFLQNSGSGTVWYRWQAGETGAYEATSGLDGVQVFRGRPGALADVGTRFRATAGDLIWIRCANHDGALLTLRRLPAGSDGMGQAEELLWTPDLVPLHLTADSAGASREAEEPGSWPKTLWWRMTVPAAGTYYAAGTRVMFYRKSRGNELQPVPVRYVAETDRPVALFDLQDGEEIWIQAAGSAEEWVDVVIGRQGPVAANDAFAHATVLPAVLPEMLDASGTSAGLDEVDFRFFPGLTGKASWWWRWTAPVDGVLSVEVPGESGVEDVRIGRGNPPGRLMLHGWVIKRWQTQPTRLRVEAGKEYFLRVEAAAHYQGKIKVNLRFGPMPVPENDDWATAFVIPEVPFEAEVDLSAATIQAGESSAAGEEQRGTLWWRWTAPAAGAYAVRGARAWRGGALSDLVEMTDYALTNEGAVDNLTGLPKLGEEQVIVMQAGETVYLSVTHPAGGSRVDFALRQLPVALNELESHAVDLGRVSRQRLEWVPPGFAGAVEHLPDTLTLWWRWTAPADGTLCFSRPGPGLKNWRLYAMDGEMPQAGKEIVRRVSPQGAWSAPVKGGQSYLLATVTGGEIWTALDLLHLPVPAMDNRNNALDLGSQRMAEGVAWSAGAGAEAGEPSQLTGGSAHHSLWWKWRAPADGYMVLQGIDQIWQETGPGALVRIPVLHPYDSSPGFKARSGVDYWLCLDRPAWEVEEIHWKIQFAETPVHNQYASRLHLPPVDWITLDFPSWGLGFEVGEPDRRMADEIWADPGYGSVGTPLSGSYWMEWTAPRDGWLHVAVGVGYTDPASQVLVYEKAGAGLADLVRMEGGLPQVRAGRTYQISVRVPWRSWNTVKLSLFDEQGNDHFANRRVLSRVYDPYLGRPERLAGLTVEPGEPGGTAVAGGTAWYSFPVPYDGPWTFTTGLLDPRQGDGPRLGIYRGTDLTGLTLAGQTPPAEDPSGWRSVTVNAQAGEVLQIQLGQPVGGTGTVGFLSVEEELQTLPPAAVPHDYFADARDLPPTLPLRLAASYHDLPGHVFTMEAGESSLPLLPRDDGSTDSRWFRWTPAVTGPVMLRGAAVIRNWQVFEGSTLASLTIPPVLHGNRQDVITFMAQAGTAYSIRFTGSPGYDTVWLEPLGTPANTTEDTAEIVNGPVPGILQGALYNSSSQMLLWRWTAPAAVVLQAKDATGGGVWEVRTNSANNYLELDQLTVSAGETVWFRLSNPGYSFSWETDAEAVRAVQSITLTAHELPLNTSPATATMLPPGTGSTSFDSTAGQHAEQWYQWHAPAGGKVKISFPYVSERTSVKVNGQAFSPDGVIDVRAGDVVLFGAFLRWGNSGTFWIRMQEAGLVRADDLVQATRILLSNENRYQTEWVNAGATAEPGEPAHGGLPAAQSTWMVCRAPATGWFSLQHNGRRVRTGVYLTATGSPQTFAELRPATPKTDVAGPQNFGFQARWTTMYEVAAGDWLAIALEADSASPLNPNQGVQFAFGTSIREFANDNFAGAVPLFTTPPGSVSIPVALHQLSQQAEPETSSLEPGEPMPPVGSGGPWQRSRWYKMAVEPGGRLQSLISISLSSLPAGTGAVQLYAGDNISTLTPVGPVLRQTGDSVDFTLTPGFSPWLQVIGTAGLGALELRVAGRNSTQIGYPTWQGTTPPSWFMGTSGAWRGQTQWTSTAIDGLPFGLRYLCGIPASRQVLTEDDRAALPQLVRGPDRLEIHYRVAVSNSQAYHYGEWMEPGVSNLWHSALKPEPVAEKPGFMKVSVPMEPGRTKLLRLRFFLP